MRIFEVILSEEVSTLLRQFAGLDCEVVLLGREFGGARVVTGAVPAPASAEAWEQLHRLSEGPIGYLDTGRPKPFDKLRAGRPEGSSVELGSRDSLPGDILLDMHPEEDPSGWKAQVLEWSGLAEESDWREISVTVT